MDAQKMKDGKAVAYFKRLAGNCQQSGYAGLIESGYKLGEDTYRCHVNTNNWTAAVYRHNSYSIDGIEINSFELGK